MPDDEEQGGPLSLNISRDSEQREIDEFEEEERRLLAEEEKVRGNYLMLLKYTAQLKCFKFYCREICIFHFFSFNLRISVILQKTSIIALRTV